MHQFCAHCYDLDPTSTKIPVLERLANALGLRLSVTLEPGERHSA
jgi:hypothetical protein